MPTYQFINKDTQEIEEHKMSYTVLEQFKTDNPHLERYFTAENLPIMSDANRMSVPGTKRYDSTFEKYVINRIKESVPGNNLAKSHKTSNLKEF